MKWYMSGRLGGKDRHWNRYRAHTPKKKWLRSTVAPDVLKSTGSTAAPAFLLS